MLARFATFAAALTAVAAQAASDASLVATLVTANSQVSKIGDLSADSQYVFNFLNGSRGTAQGGFAVQATSTNFPALLTGNGAMTVGVLGPCGLNTPHTHPRGTEIQIVVQGGPIYTEMFMENGARVVKNNVSLGMATIFPKGSLHFQQNLACEPTIFVSSFDNIDPGTDSIATGFFGLDQEVIAATLGETGVQIFNDLAIPTNFALGAQSCLQACGLQSNFNFSATFGEYAIFSNSSWTTSHPSVAGSAALAAQKGSSSSGTADVPFDQNPLKGTVIGLGVAAAALLLAVAALAAMMCCRRRSVRATPSVASRFQGDISAPRGYPYATPYDDAEGLTGSRQSIDHKA